MNAQEYRERIITACQQVGTYQPSFDDVIDSLALMLQRRDEANELFLASGGHAIIQYTNKGGATNPSKNPALVLWDELNKSALQYWRDLGLTPAGLRRISEEALAPKKKDSLAEALKELGAELNTTI